jgi:pyridoxine 4-dehydrogenase
MGEPRLSRIVIELRSGEIDVIHTDIAVIAINASAAGQFRIGDVTINRLGYGAMRLTGRGIWGPPSDGPAALATLRRLPEIGVNFIDTADSYGPDVSETRKHTA